MESKMLPALHAQYEGDKERNAQMRSKFNKGEFASRARHIFRHP
jgi:predicted secreted protein